MEQGQSSAASSAGAGLGSYFSKTLKLHYYLIARLDYHWKIIFFFLPFYLQYRTYLLCLGSPLFFLKCCSCVNFAYFEGLKFKNSENMVTRRACDSQTSCVYTGNKTKEK